MCLSYRELKSKDVTVRLTHRCAWCAEIIFPKAAARKRVYVFDGEFISDWMHPECFDAYSNASREDICDGWLPGDFERPKLAEQL